MCGSCEVTGDTAYMDKLFTDEQLNVGRILILTNGHAVTTTRIEQLTSAKTATKINWFEGYAHIDTFVWSTLTKALDALADPAMFGANFYYIQGDGATSALLTFQKNHAYKSVAFDAKKLKTLHNACIAKEAIDRVKNLIGRVQDGHNDLSLMLASLKLRNSISKKSNALEKLARDYGDTELRVAMDKINAAITDCW